MALLEIDDLSKSFLLHRVDRRIQGCQHVSFALEPGQFVGITGRSGSGKSTILRCIWRTNLPEQGRILYDSARFGLLDLAQATQRQMLYLRAYELGYVSQFLNALPRQTARDIVLKSALEAYGPDERARAEAETERMLRHFDLDEGLWELYPRTFSGGEKLRLNIAAAMIKRPRLLLLDEPTASLDNASKLKVRTLIEQLKAEGTTMLGIFHDLEGRLQGGRQAGRPAGRHVDIDPDRGRFGQDAAVSAAPEQIAAQALAGGELGYPGGGGDDVPGKGGAFVGDGVLTDDPAVPFRLVALHAPALDCGVADGQVLHPLDITQVADTVLDVDMPGRDDDFPGEDAHGSSVADGCRLPSGTQHIPVHGERPCAFCLFGCPGKDFACLVRCPGVEEDRTYARTGGRPSWHSAWSVHGM